MPFTQTAAYDRLVHDVLLSEIRQEVVAVVPHLIDKSCRIQSSRVARTTPGRVCRPEERECRGLRLHVENHLFQRASEAPEFHYAFVRAHAHSVLGCRLGFVQGRAGDPGS